MLFALFVIGLVVAAIHLFRDTHPRTPNRIAEIVLLWLLVILVGVGGVLTFIAHTVYADTTAASIGWPAGNPNNAGPALYTDIADPLILIALLVIARRRARSRGAPAALGHEPS
jgi:hypothetical protein